ncbi:hypothetical protein [Dietzia sp. Alg238-R159]|uniref:hypothetical protein n=1 Tax=Dietzia sp. Alg238-R159 TaxID=2305986 RepID=UPI0013D319D8|nr:hypothetical protein [Dietzia sp. Alg238-R159]
MPRRCECELLEYPDYRACPECEEGSSPEDYSDTTLRMRRYKSGRSYLLSKGTAASATFAGVLGALLTFSLVPEGEPWRRALMSVFVLTFMGGLAIFRSRAQLSAPAATLFWGRVADTGDDGELHLSRPVASCPWCDENMTVRRFFTSRGYVDAWVCRSGEREHRLPFDMGDFTEFAE